MNETDRNMKAFQRDRKRTELILVSLLAALAIGILVGAGYLANSAGWLG